LYTNNFSLPTNGNLSNYTDSSDGGRVYASVLGSFGAEYAGVTESIVFETTNAFRGFNGKPAFQWSSLLSQVARAHSADMAKYNYFDHVNLSGQSPYDRMEAAGYSFWSAGENIAAGNSVGTVILNQWVNSSGHRNNMLSDYQELGVGYAENSSASYRYYSTQCFGTPQATSTPTAAPTPAPTTTPVPTAVPTATPLPTAAPTPSPVPTGAPTFDEATLYNKMIALKAQYPEGMHWTNNDYYVWRNRYQIPGSSNTYSTYTGYGCVGFAMILSDAAFGDLLARVHEDFNNIRVGDIIRVNNNSHSVIVLAFDGADVIVAEGNYNSSIHWERRIPLATIKQGDYIVTRYPK
jgi:hypothetical protein